MQRKHGADARPDSEIAGQRPHRGVEIGPGRDDHGCTGQFNQRCGVIRRERRVDGGGDPDRLSGECRRVQFAAVGREKHHGIRPFDAGVMERVGETVHGSQESGIRERARACPPVRIGEVGRGDLAGGPCFGMDDDLVGGRGQTAVRQIGLLDDGEVVGAVVVRSQLCGHVGTPVRSVRCARR